MLIYITWIVNGCELYIEKNNYPCVDNVACSSHYAYDMTYHEMTNLHFICTVTSRRVGCGCMVLLFTILGECVMSSEMGPHPKLRLMVV